MGEAQEQRVKRGAPLHGPPLPAPPPALPRSHSPPPRICSQILAHNSFEQALSFVLANRLSNATMLPTQLFEIFYKVSCSAWTN